MTFNPLAAQAVYALGSAQRGAVCELGNQRFTVTEDVLRRIYMPKAPSSTEEFYRWLEWEPYVALDVNTDMGAKVVDLNKPIQGRHYDLMGRFDLVTNNGTGEHIFNQDAVFQNVHDLAKVGGAMLHILPMSPWVNHGFYNYNPVLFRDLAVANGYEWLFLWLSDRWGNKVELEENDFSEAFREKKPRALEKAIGQVIAHKGYDCSIVVAWRKVHDRAFRRPFQGKYMGDIADSSVKATYGA
jgi:SAM-dependent methyltransferase